MRASCPHRGRAQNFLASISSLLACSFFAASLSPCASASHGKSGHTQNSIKRRALSWNPPNVDGRLKSLSSTPPCLLSQVLQHASQRVTEMQDDLPNFTADETIQSESIGQLSDSPGSSGDLPDYRSGTFQYLAILKTAPWGPFIQEVRTPTQGTQPFAASAQDRGLAELALIFLPKLQADYDMKCEGSTTWNGQPAWVVHFQQRPDATPHSFSYSDPAGNVHPARLKGRAWISTANGGVVHLETALMKPIPALGLRNSWFSIDYAPVQFRSYDVRFWLPQTADAYTDFGLRRTIIYHSFANFMVFSVRTKQQVKATANPH
jgi:hypothetical protein